MFSLNIDFNVVKLQWLISFRNECRNHKYFHVCLCLCIMIEVNMVKLFVCIYECKFPCIGQRTTFIVHLQTSFHFAWDKMFWSPLCMIGYLACKILRIPLLLPILHGGMLRLQMCTTTSGFLWALGIYITDLILEGNCLIHWTISPGNTPWYLNCECILHLINLLTKIYFSLG